MLFRSYTITNYFQVNNLISYVSICCNYYPFRRINIMFNKIEKESVHTDYGLLEKICCRDYDGLIKKCDHHDATEGELRNSLLMLLLHLNPGQ